MRRFRRIAAIALAAAFSLIVVPPALGASGVFGGSTAARRSDRPHHRRQGQEAAVGRDRMGGSVRRRRVLPAGDRADGGRSAAGVHPESRRPGRGPEREGALRRHATGDHGTRRAGRRHQRRALRRAPLRARLGQADGDGLDLRQGDPGRGHDLRDREPEVVGHARRRPHLRVERPRRTSLSSRGSIEGQAGRRPARGLGHRQLRAAGAVLPGRRPASRTSSCAPAGSATRSRAPIRPTTAAASRSPMRSQAPWQSGRSAGASGCG